MAGNSVRRESDDDLAIRINELATKATQLLQFLSFAILGAATLRTARVPADQTLVRAMWWWILAVFPILIAVLPVKDIRWNCHAWYRFLVRMKFLLLWVAVALSGVGAIQFLRAVS